MAVCSGEHCRKASLPSLEGGPKLPASTGWRGRCVGGAAGFVRASSHWSALTISSRALTSSAAALTSLSDALASAVSDVNVSERRSCARWTARYSTDQSSSSSSSIVVFPQCVCRSTASTPLKTARHSWQVLAAIDASLTLLRLRSTSTIISDGRLCRPTASAVASMRAARGGVQPNCARDILRGGGGPPDLRIYPYSTHSIYLCRRDQLNGIMPGTTQPRTRLVYSTLTSRSVNVTSRPASRVDTAKRCWPGCCCLCWLSVYVFRSVPAPAVHQARRDHGILGA